MLKYTLPGVSILTINLPILSITPEQALKVQNAGDTAYYYSEQMVDILISSVIKDYEQKLNAQNKKEDAPHDTTP